MSRPDPRLSRRHLLQRAGLAIAVGPAALGLAATAARAAAKTPKADVSYQFAPHGEQHCGACVSFLPGDSPQGAGTCKVVDGVIPQNGWCVFFSKR